jgi:hypothetical protein
MCNAALAARAPARKVLFRSVSVIDEWLLAPLHPAPKGKTPVIPLQDLVTASIAVYVRAQAQQAQ